MVQFKNMNSLSTQPYKGTRDFYPEDKQRQAYIFNTWRRVVERFGYLEYGAPLLEPLDVYTAKSGQELANEQTYTFEDRGGRTVAIRPEMTPSISRMVAAKRQELAYPARLYSIANFMRYERPQRGREREFWQLNADVFGVDNEQADIEILTMADAILKEFGAGENDYIIRVNNRTFINDVLTKWLELDDDRAKQLVKLLDRKNKITENDFASQAAEILNDEDKIAKLTQLLNVTDLANLPEELQGYESLTSLRLVLDSLKTAGVTAATFDMTLMRGLDYYTGTVFEVFDTHPDNNRSLFGGGRYDGLVGLFGAESLSAVGMAPGSSMIENFLDVRGLFPAFAPTAVLYVGVLDEQYTAATALASELRAAGINAEIDISGRKLDKQLKAVLKKQIPYVLFVGKNEAANQQYTLKNTADEAEQVVSFEQLVEALR
jgi:histidyl-tRNA synthetase